MTSNDPDTKLEMRKADLGFAVVALGIVLVTGMFIAVILKSGSSTDTTTIATSFTAVIGTLVGAYFGIQKGSEGKDKAERQRDQAKSERDTARDERKKYKQFGDRLIEAHNQSRGAPPPPPPPTFSDVAMEFQQYSAKHP